MKVNTEELKTPFLYRAPQTLLKDPPEMDFSDAYCRVFLLLLLWHIRRLLLLLLLLVIIMIRPSACSAARCLIRCQQQKEGHRADPPTRGLPDLVIIYHYRQHHQLYRFHLISGGLATVFLFLINIKLVFIRFRSILYNSVFLSNVHCLQYGSVSRVSFLRDLCFLSTNLIFYSLFPFLSTSVQLFFPLEVTDNQESALAYVCVSVFMSMSVREFDA